MLLLCLHIAAVFFCKFRETWLLLVSSTEKIILERHTESADLPWANICRINVCNISESYALQKWTASSQLHLYTKFHENQASSFCIIPLTDRQTKSHRKHEINSHICLHLFLNNMYLFSDVSVAAKMLKPFSRNPSTTFSFADILYHDSCEKKLPIFFLIKELPNN